MEPEVIKMISLFMARATLKGEEVDAYITCQKELQKAYATAVGTGLPSGGTGVGAEDGGGVGGSDLL